MNSPGSSNRSSRRRASREASPVAGAIPLNATGTMPKPKETRPVSDSGKLVWSRFIGPAQAALSQVQNALAASQEIVAERIVSEAGLKTEDGWKFNAAKMQFERYDAE